MAPGREYIVRGNLAGAVYTSFTMESGAADGAYATQTSGVLNDTQMDIDADGNYEIRLGGPPAERNWLGIPDDGGRITTRHYFEFPWSASASQTLHVPISIEVLDPPPPPPRWNDERVADSLQHVINHVQQKTVDAPKPQPGVSPAPFVSITPNDFPQPVVPGNMAFAAFDAAYSMAPYLHRPRRGAGDQGPLARVRLRQRLPLEPLVADVRLREPPGQPEPGQHHPRRRRRLHA